MHLHPRRRTSRVRRILKTTAIQNGIHSSNVPLTILQSDRQQEMGQRGWRGSGVRSCGGVSAVSCTTSPVRLGRPPPASPLLPFRESHGKAVERNSYARTHTHTHSFLCISLSFSLLFLLSLSLSPCFSPTISSGTTRIVCEGRTFPFSFFLLNKSSFRIHPSFVIVPSSFCFCCNFKDALFVFPYVPFPSCVLILCFRPKMITLAYNAEEFSSAPSRKRYRKCYFFQLFYFSLSISRFSLSLCSLPLLFLSSFRVSWFESDIYVDYSNCFSRRDILRCREYIKIHFSLAYS